MKTYTERAQKFWTEGAGSKKSSSALANAFLRLMDRKQTNLCVAADLIHKKEILSLADAVGPYICMLKTHVDIIVDFDDEFVCNLLHLARKHDFMIFEDRKFADIGNTVQHQYAHGIYKIASWSHITNAHPIPGDGIVEGLKQVGLEPQTQETVSSEKSQDYLKLPRGLLLLAEMSSAGSMATGDYTVKTLEMARRHRDFVIGFVCARRLHDNPEEEDFIVFTPGVQLSAGTDALGQQYRTPKKVIADGSDCIIVGRGIYKAENPAEQACLYRDAGWKAYLERCDA